MTDQPDLSSETQAAMSLLTAAAVRERAHQLLQAGLDGRLEHFTVDLDRLDACADEVVATIREAYPSLDIPFHARWRHFSAGGHDRWGAVMHSAPWTECRPDGPRRLRPRHRLRAARCGRRTRNGATWKAAPARPTAAPEGLAVASFDMFVERRLFEQSRRSFPGRCGRAADPDGG